MTKGGIVAVICLTVIVSTVLIMYYGLPAYRDFKKEHSPKPVVVSYRCDELSSSLTEYSFRVITTIRNDGDGGYVIVYSTIRDKKTGKSYTHNKTVWVSNYSTKEVEIIFNEPSFLSGFHSWIYWSEVRDTN